MNRNHFPRLKWLTVLSAILLSSFAVKAQSLIAAVPIVDSTTVHRSFNGAVPAITSHLKRRAERQRLLRFLKDLNITGADENEAPDKQWNHLAGLFTRLRLYPLAMKCFRKTLTPDSLVADDIPITDNDQQGLANQLKLIGYKGKSVKSNIIKVNNIVETFNDGKKAVGYALILHIKQPVRGTPRVHKFIYTGHTFITLIKFNIDSTYAALTFGFGPHKDHLLAATPLVPTSSSKFTDDGGHLWDEAVGKFISKRRFEKILQLTRQYDGLAYNLNNNNCTDFGLKAASLAGLEVKDTKGRWPLGFGNNPGVTGESILLGKFNNADTGDLGRLYIDTARVVRIGAHNSEIR